MTRTTPQPDRSDVVRDAVASADRRRRAHHANRRLGRGAPLVAAAALILAAAGRWTGWSPVLPLSVLGLGVIGLALDAWLSRRARAISDEMAARIDTDADLGGELRSATWFAARASRNEWAAFHLDRAADRVRGVNWTALYPGASYMGVRIATSVMVISTLGLAFLPTGRTPIDVVALPPSAARPARPDRGLLSGQEQLSGELYEQFEELLAGDSRTLVAQQTTTSGADPERMLSRLAEMRDREELKELAQALGEPSARPQEQLSDLADRARRAAEAGSMSPEARKALEQLAENLEQAAAAEADDRAQQTVASAEQSAAESDRSRAGSGIEEAAIQFLKESAGGGGEGVIESAGSGGAGVMMMMSDDRNAAARAGSGVGGGSSEDIPGDGEMPPLPTLREEVLEANADSPGQNVITDTGRKTEQGQATVTFTGSAAGTFDRSRAMAAPAVPESRRSSVQDYFHRNQ